MDSRRVGFAEFAGGVAVRPRNVFKKVPKLPVCVVRFKWQGLQPGRPATFSRRTMLSHYLHLSRIALLLLVVGGCAEFPRIDPSGQRIFAPGNTGYTLEPKPFDESNSTAITVARQEVVAPINSEVIVVATAYGPNGQPASGRRVEWLLAQGGVGEFITPGDRDETSFGHTWRNAPRKVNNSYLIGETSPVNTLITRGTIRNDDDVSLTVGQTWASVTSPVEGTSYVTAYGPEVHSWDRRRATTTISWVDAKWVPPAPAVVKVGDKHVLTTTVTRQTDGTPLVGWRVRYEILNGPTADNGQVVEVATDAAGRASVEMGQPSPGSGTVPVNVQLFRPSDPGNPNSKRALIGSVNTQVVFTESAPSATGSAGTTPTISGPPTTPGTPPVSNPGSVVASSAQLDITVQGPEQAIAVGDTGTFNITITNRGTATATGLKLVDAFDPGLELKSDSRGVMPSPFTKAIRDIPPNNPLKLGITFTAKQAGQLCHTVEVQGDGGVRASKSACLTAVAATLTPSFDLTMYAIKPLRQGDTTITPVKEVSVEDKIWFRVEVRNKGAAAARNVRFTCTAAQSLSVDSSDIEQSAGGTGGKEGNNYVFTIPSIPPGPTGQSFNIACTAKAPVQGACLWGTLLAEGSSQPIQQEACVTIRPLAANSNLQIDVQKNGDPVRVNGEIKFAVTVTNAGANTENNVTLLTALPTELRLVGITPGDPKAAVGPGNSGLRFDPFSLPAGETRKFELTFTAVTAGQIRFDAGVTSQLQPTTISDSKTVTVFADR